MVEPATWLVIGFMAFCWAALLFGYMGHLFFDKAPR